MFMLLSLYHSHCESLRDSSDVSSCCPPSDQANRLGHSETAICAAIVYSTLTIVA